MTEKNKNKNRHYSKSSPGLNKIMHTKQRVSAHKKLTAQSRSIKRKNLGEDVWGTREQKPDNQLRHCLASRDYFSLREWQPQLHGAAPSTLRARSPASPPDLLPDPYETRLPKNPGMDVILANSRPVALIPFRWTQWDIQNLSSAMCHWTL